MTEKFPEPFEFLNEEKEEYIKWYVWAFEKKYGKGSWEKTLAEKRKAIQDNEEHTHASNGNGSKTRSADVPAPKDNVNKLSDALKHHDTKDDEESS
jgi:hypothetical protein